MSEYGLMVYFLWSPGRINYFLASGSLVLRYCDPRYNCPVCLQVALVLSPVSWSYESEMQCGPPTLRPKAFPASPRFWGV